MKSLWRGKRRFIIGRFGLLLITLSSPSLHARAATYYLIVSGLGGEPDYEQRFTSAARDIARITKASNTDVQSYELTGQDATAARMKNALAIISRSATPQDAFILILIGHGSFDGTIYKFNLPGPDVSAEEIADMCSGIRAGRQLIVDTSSASGAAVSPLRHSGRAIIAATKSGTEKSATVFVRYWIEALQDPSADTDKSGSISALEAFMYATGKTNDFYKKQNLLATEHAVFTDVSQSEPVRDVSTGQGALLASLTLVRLDSVRPSASNPANVQLLRKKEELEQKIDALKSQKAAMDSTEYKKQLTTLLLQLAGVQQELDR
jgi:hypothetical protein